jgi:hypothetical protein
MMETLYLVFLCVLQHGYIFTFCSCEDYHQAIPIVADHGYYTVSNSNAGTVLPKNQWTSRKYANHSNRRGNVCDYCNILLLDSWQ